MNQFKVLLVFIGLFCYSFVSSVAAPPHILFILADDYGWGDIGYHGSQIPTPNLDRLAGDGVKLDNYYVQPVCTPARASIMTGRYPIRYGLQHDVIQAPQPAGLFLNETILPTKLKEAGYATHAIGKWHLGFFNWKYTPTYRGFDSYVGYYAGGEDYFSHNATWVYTGFDFRNNTENFVSKKGEYSSAVFEEEAFRIINGYVNTPKAEQKPLFIYLAMQTCHIPLEVPPEYLAKCDFGQWVNANHKTYCGMTINMDLTIGNITNALEKAGILNNTLIVFSTDNGGLPVDGGGGSNYPLRGGKFTLWEGGVRGVGFITGAGIPKAKQGTKYNGLMHLTDWFPTLINVAGGSTKGTFPLDGVDQWGAITSNAAPPRTEVLHNIDEAANNSALRSGDWKIVVGPQQYDGWLPPALSSVSDLHIQARKTLDNNTISLFNIATDPNEKNNVAAQNPEKVKELLARIEFYRKGMVSHWNPPNDPKSNPSNFNGNWMPWLE